MRVLHRFWLALTMVIGACGGSSVDEREDPETLIQNACDNVVGLQCGLVMFDCIDNLTDARAESVAKGCGPAVDLVLRCFAEQVTACSPDLSEVCSAQFEALDACEKKGGGQECSLGSGGAGPGAPPGFQQCDIWCSSWSAHCETGSSANLACSCTDGPNSGAKFSATSCKEMSTLGAQHCEG